MKLHFGFLLLKYFNYNLYTPSIDFNFQLDFQSELMLGNQSREKIHCI